MAGAIQNETGQISKLQTNIFGISLDLKKDRFLWNGKNQTSFLYFKLWGRTCYIDVFNIDYFKII